MLSCVDGEAAHQIKTRTIILTIMFFNPLGCVLKDFFVGGRIFGTECAYISSVAQQQGRCGRT